MVFCYGSQSLLVVMELLFNSIFMDKQIKSHIYQI